MREQKAGQVSFGTVVKSDLCIERTSSVGIVIACAPYSTTFLLHCPPTWVHFLDEHSIISLYNIYGWMDVEAGDLFGLKK